MKKKFIRKKLRNSRARVHYYALDPLKQYMRSLKHQLEDISLLLEDISTLQDSMRASMVTLLDRSVTIITGLCCISAVLAVLLFLFFFV